MQANNSTADSSPRKTNNSMADASPANTNNSMAGSSLTKDSPPTNASPLPPPDNILPNPTNKLKDPPGLTSKIQRKTNKADKALPGKKSQDDDPNQNTKEDK
jgi:hypothetical protein